MRKIKFNQLAKSELRDSILYYNSIREFLGIEFFQEVKGSLNSIRNYPAANIEMGDGIKRCLYKAISFQYFLLV